MLIPVYPAKFQRRPAKARPSKTAPLPAVLNVVDVTVLDIGDQALTWVFDGPTGIDGSVVPAALVAKGPHDPVWMEPSSIAAFDDVSVTLLYGQSSGFDGSGVWNVDEQPDGMNAASVPESGTITGPTPPGLVLVSADYDGGRNAYLTFDRPVSLEDGAGGGIEVNNGDSGTLFEDALAGSDGSATVHIYMPADVPSSEPGTFMNAPGTTGIFATDDGGTWAGVIALPLPFP